MKLPLALRFSFIVLCLPVWPNLATAADAKPKPVAKQDAAALLTSAQKALAYTTKATRNAGEKLSPKNPSAKPFLLSLKKINDALDHAEAGLAAKDPKFFKALDQARAAVSEMQVTWDLTGSNNKDVVAGAKQLGGAVIALQTNYSPLAARRSKGGELTAAEKARFAKIKAQQSALDKKIAALAAKYKSDPALSAGLQKIRGQSARIARSGNTVSAFTDALDLLATIGGLIAGYSYYMPPAGRNEWVMIESAPSTWNYETYYEETTYEWSSVEEYVAVYDEESVEVSAEEVAEEETYLDENEFEMTDAEEDAVAEESNEIPADEVASDEMESQQEEVAEGEEEEAMTADEGETGGEEEAVETADSDGGEDAGDEAMESADDSGEQADSEAADEPSDDAGDESAEESGGDGMDDAGADGGDAGEDTGAEDGGGDDGGADDGGGDEGGGEE
ncbi:MAG: hypothetical protein FGM15_09090 [Chthoniobacterales bacterium]|nr:hypothetical protein [Chthoniobacterales bacterium]